MKYSELALMFKEFRESFHTTGAFIPSSRYLSREILKPWSHRTKPASILEVGPGTGAITKELIQSLGKGDDAWIVELNEAFYLHLKEKFKSEPSWKKVAPLVHLIHGPVQELTEDGRFDYLICGLPFNNFPASLVRSILRKFELLVKPGGTVSFFEYAAVRELKSPMSPKEEKLRLASVGKSLKRFSAKHKNDAVLIARNLPPAWVNHVTLQSERTREKSKAAA
ncbi:MAG: methyltransferase domain-containing protein [Verrucomicrobiota bacterium]|nr:methyltransferase domain-containing protein [Verrucomicrobiota bacterium]